ncbi:hypothetical protein [Mesorhizobium sp. B2-4-10]|uniref:hypothetical protein n=2 Tax=Mesorhizobium TaxID=68287 RepID=UPI001FEE52DB|nr:hypothetical protein [Mesorhizobium sp. B2-4-10]
MNSIKLAVIASFVGLSASQAFAEDAMGTMTMMKAGQVTAIMPDGHMGTMTPDAKMSAEMMKMAKPIKHCMMMMTDAKGKAFMIDTSTKKAQAECEKMAMWGLPSIDIPAGSKVGGSPSEPCSRRPLQHTQVEISTCRC